jgi:PAS domain S-box-containing protein
MTTSHFQDSLALFDADGRLVDWDEGFACEWSFAGALLRRGTDYARLLRAAMEQPAARQLIEEYAVLAEDVFLTRMKGFGSDRTHEYRAESGRIVQVDERRLASGCIHRVARDITDEKQAETALADAQHRLEAVDSHDYGVLTESRRSPDGIYSFEPISEGLCRLLDLPAALIGGNPMLIYSRFEASPEDNAAAAARMEHSAKTLESFSHEFRVRDGKNRLRWIRQSMMPRREPDGTVVFSGVMRDVTREMEAEDQVEMLRSVVVQSSDSIVIFESDSATGAEGTIVYANTKFSELFGWAPDAVIGRREAFLADRPVMAGGAIAEARRRDDGKSVEFETSSRDGRVFWVEARVATIQTFDDGRLRWAVISRDITKRKKDEEAVRISEERFRLLADATNDVIWDLDMESGTTWWNTALTMHYGHTAASIPATVDQWNELVHPDDRRRIADRIADVMSGNKTLWTDEYRFQRGNGSFAMVSARAFVIRDENGLPTRMLGSMADVTQRLEMQERLTRAQRLEAIGQLTGGIAHDFNNLLTVILGCAEMLTEGLADDPDSLVLAELTAGAAERGAELTQRLLAFGRRQTLEPQVIDINKLVTGMDGLLRRSLRGDIDIEMSLADAMWSTSVDPAQFENAVLNLAINARDAMPDGGRLTIETKTVFLDTDYAGSHEEVIPGQYVMLSVSDTGTGMSEDVLRRAFEPFFTTKDVGKGSGLGLSMIFGFMKQSGGHAKIYSEVGEGTTVKLYLPRTATDRQGGDVQDSEAAPIGGREHILAVEDDPGVRKYVVRQLRGLGYQVTEAANGQDALQIISRQPDIALLFTDVIMPGGMNGRQLANDALKLRHDLKVLFTSGYTDNAIVHHGRLDPDVLFLAKPYRRRDLASKIRQALDEGSANGNGSEARSR